MLRYKQSTTQQWAYLFEKDSFGNVTRIFDESGEMHAEYAYNAFGECFYASPNKETVVNEYDKLTFLIGTLNPFRWKGHYLDTQTGLYYIGESWYDAETGRYVNAGTAVDLIANATEINGTNLYSFCYNNPHNCGQNSGNHESYFELLPGEKD